MKRLALLLLMPLSLFGAYSYYYTDTLGSFDATKWTQNGTDVYFVPGQGYQSYGGDSLISTVAVPDGTTQYEVNATATGTWAGVVVLYLNASSNAMSGPTPSGTYYAVELSSGTLTLYSRVSGTVSTLASTTVPCPSTCQIRAVRAAGNQILVYVNGYLYLSVTNGAITTGQPGIGMRYGSVTYISQVQLGPLDRVAPNAFNPSYIGTSSFPNRVDIQWPGVTDDTNGTGVAFYSIYRNGSFMANVEAPSATYSDTTVSAGTSYSYQLYAFDFHMNSVSTTIAVTAAPTGAIDPRRVGLRPTAEYWGANPEQIDMLSGNLNFSVPFLNAVGLGGEKGGNWTAGLSLSYNSQNWRNDTGGNWNLGRDVGYGYGWKLLAGSLTPAWSGYFTLDHYTFMDASGAEYRLTQNAGGVWTSTESNYVSYDSNAQVLYFRDGMSWIMGCVSAGSEQDSGTLYPTVIQDTRPAIPDPNKITISYMAGGGLSTANSSSRIYQIFDLRAPTSPANSTYTFSYTTVSGAPHLHTIINNIGTAEAYTFSMTTQALVSPFDGTAFGNEAILGSVNVTNIPGTQQTFTYDTSGELTKSVLPKGGYLAWAYGNFTYSGSRIQREVQTRYLSKDGTVGSQTSYPITHEASDGLHTIHAWTILDDPGGVGEKYWAFSQSGVNLGLTTQYQGRHFPGPVVKVQNDYTWTQDSAGNNYIGTVLITSDPGANQAVMQKTQNMDIHGNVLQTQIYNYGNLTTPARTYNYTYVSPTYFPRPYIFNRLASATVKEGSTTVTLVTNGYDSSARLTSSVSLSGSLALTRSPVSGGILSATNNGLTTTITLDTATNSLPAQITVGSLNQGIGYTTFLGLDHETTPNSATTSFTYDSAARPSTSVSPYITTYYSYPNVNTSAASPNNTRWTQTTSDGLGRTINVASGTGSYFWGATVVSQVDTVYNSCGCSPLGKMTQTSLPHGPSGTVLWTTYTYDGIGRTVSIQAPDGVSTTTYSYLGNVATVTDPAGAWKKYTSDGLGRLTQVEEPNPAGGSYFTTYSYDMLDHLIGVSMPRPTGTQTRIFNYIDPATSLPGAFLRSVTNPENGTVSYTYDSSNRLATVIDAKNQKKLFTYDSLNRVTKVQRYVYQGGAYVEDVMLQTNYTYDAGTYGLGRLTGSTYYGGNCTSYNPYSSPAGCDSIQETYTYNRPGAMLSKILNVTRGTYSGSLTTNWTVDSEGRPATVTYPGWTTCGAYQYTCTSVPGSSYTYAYDTMGRMKTMTDTVNTHTLVSGITYGVANEVQQMTSGYTSAVNSETRTYNSMFQLTQLTVGSTLNIQYGYSATQNNGKITSQSDVISGEQIAYTYDALNRLASAQTTQTGGTQWGQSYNYDGFGNLTDQNYIKGSVPTMHVAYNYLTNRQTGDTADLNGNIGSGNIYDLENRLVQPSGSTARYGYDASNKRMWRGDSGTGVDEIAFWAGQKLATYKIVTFSGYSSIYFGLTSTNVYFGSKLISKGTYTTFGGSGDYVTLAPVAADRLGSIGKFYPFGTERPSATANDTEKFTGYFRDAATGLDYADQRYEQPGVGRFMTPDPYGGSAKAADPGSWNRYAYVGGDPVNRVDPRGLQSALDEVLGPPGSPMISIPGGPFPGDGSCNFYGIPCDQIGPCDIISCEIAQAQAQVADLVATGIPSSRVTRDANGNLVYTNELYGGSFTDCDSCLRVSTAYGYQYSDGSFHGGIDLATGGRTGISALSLTDGVVVRVGASGFGPNSVTIKSPDGTFFTYGHLASHTVNIGDAVTGGTPIGEIGNLGTSSGIHLHIQASVGDMFMGQMLGIGFP